jgi:hypothetical protein
MINVKVVGPSMAQLLTHRKFCGSRHRSVPLVYLALAWAEELQTRILYIANKSLMCAILKLRRIVDDMVQQNSWIHENAHSS